MNNIIILFLGMTKVFAQTPPTTPWASGTSFGENLQTYIPNLYAWSIAIGVSLATLMLIYAGYLYATSAGNPEQVNAAKEHIIGALVGLGLLLAAYIVFDAIKI